MRPRIDERESEMLATVVRLLETEGHEAVQVRRVAAEASVSLATLYRVFGTRDELILRALESWMIDHAYVRLDDLPTDGAPVERLSAIVHAVFAPWERQPHMLAAYVQARWAPGGRRLDDLGFGLVNPRAFDVLADFDPEFVSDFAAIVQHVMLAALGRFAAGEITVEEIVSLLDRTIARLISPVSAQRRATPR